MSNCKQCGLCCLYVEMKMGKTAFDKQWMEFLRVTRPDNFIFSKDGKTLKIISPCKHLDKDKKCRIYENRPDTCKEYECVRNN